MSAVAAAPAPTRFQRWLAAWCVLTVLALGVFGASPQLHEHLHADAGHPDHGCAVTWFSAGIENAGSVDLLVSPAQFPARTEPALPVRPADEVLHRLPPGRGPPLR
ncbi:MAG: hypothetical protein JNG83_09960 [Opitutaceae bacterium]|nr:hypothetical protein [Opitutaceae bacterium]